MANFNSAEINGEKCLCNAKKHWVKVSDIKPIDVLRDETAVKMYNIAKELNKHNVEAKKLMFDEMFSFLDLSAMEYDKQWKTQAGNAYIYTYCKTIKVSLTVTKYMAFDERLQLAKEKVDECLSKWTADSNANVHELVMDAFNVDKKGNLSTHKLLALFKYDFDDDDWKEGINILRKAYHIIASKEHMRFYKRDENGKFQQLVLDFCKL